MSFRYFWSKASREGRWLTWYLQALATANYLYYLQFKYVQDQPFFIPEKKPDGTSQRSPVLGVQPSGPAAVDTAGDAQEEQQQRHKDACNEGTLAMRACGSERWSNIQALGSNTYYVSLALSCLLHGPESFTVGAPSPAGFSAGLSPSDVQDSFRNLLSQFSCHTRVQPCLLIS
jgi:hypothetical protein